MNNLGSHFNGFERLDRKIERERKALDMHLKYVEKKPATAAFHTFSVAYDLFVMSSFSGSLERKACISYLELAKEMIGLHFKVVVNEGKTFNYIDKHGTPVSVLGVNKGTYILLPHWLEAFSLALIFRDNQLLNDILLFGRQQYSKSNIKWNAFDKIVLEFIKGIYDPCAEIDKLVLGVMEKSDPEFIPDYQQNYCFEITLPLINLYVLALSAKNENKFNEVFHNAVEAHSRYWIRKDKSDKFGYRAILIAAAAIFASERKGYSLPFDSEYVPRWLTKINQGVTY